jgi:hypothetical protein
VFAGTAALIKATTNVCSSLGGVGLLLLTQLASQAGQLTASSPAISTVDPLLSVAIGVLVYGEHLRRGRSRVWSCSPCCYYLQSRSFSSARWTRPEHSDRPCNSPRAVSECRGRTERSLPSRARTKVEAGATGSRSDKALMPINPPSTGDQS